MSWKPSYEAALRLGPHQHPELLLPSASTVSSGPVHGGTAECGLRCRGEMPPREGDRITAHSSPAPPSVLPAAPPGDCRGLSPRPAAPELTRHLPTLAAAHNTILCLAAGCRALHTNSRLPQSSISPCALQTRFGEGQRNDPAKPLASPPATASPPLPLRYVPASLPLPSMRLFSPRP